MNESRLFKASCIALIATAMSFAIRGDIMTDLETIFGLSKTQLGWIAGAAFWGFGLSILIGGPLCDLLGMGSILRLAAAGHIGGTLLTVFAPNFTLLFLATVVIGIANGLVEAAINPLVATIYSRDKTAKLTRLHAWFPGGIVIGGVACFLLSQISQRAALPGGGTYLTLGGVPSWQIKMLLMFIPAVIYAWMLIGQRFPATERAAAGVPFGAMFKELGRPLFIVVWLCMWLTAATELGFGSWVSNIFNDVMKSAAQAGILVLVLMNGIMYLMRQFFGNVSHRVPPPALIAVTAISAAVGLFWFSRAATPFAAFAATALVAIGVAFWWPTMLGITSERFPRSGALGLAVIGATGSIATALSGPIMGAINDALGPRAVMAVWAILPLVLVAIFGAMHLADKRRGGYRAEHLELAQG
jgi:fucose permease